MSLARRFAPALGVVFAAVVAAVLFVGPASPAHAHDGLAVSDPIADSVLDIAPVAITLTFTADILGGAASTAVIVNDASGAQVQSGDPVIDGAVVTQALSPKANSGAFLVTWRVVSSDGHPISGEFSYTVNAPAPEPSESGSSAPSAEPSATPSESATVPSATPSVIAPTAPAPGGGTDYTPWGIAALVALVLSAITAVAVLLRRRSASRDSSTSGDNNGTPEQSSKG